MKNALIGYTGFVGSSLLKQTRFESQYRSTDIQNISGKYFDLIVCAAAPAQKWIANKEPNADYQKIKNLIEHLKTVYCKTFVLISTVDVFNHPVEINENTLISEEGLHPYGLHRRLLEKFIETHFANHLIIRLPGLVGPGLRKNAIFDLQNNNNIHALDSRNVYQFYPMVNLWYDIQIALKYTLKIVHLTAEPISIAEVAQAGFGIQCNQTSANSPITYDFRTQYSKLFGGQGDYQYQKRETIQAIRAYAQTEQVLKIKETSS